MTLAPSPETVAQIALQKRLNDPAVANALSSLLDHADLLAILVEGLDGFVARSEVIGDSLVSSLTELRAVVADNETLSGAGADLGQLVGTASKLAKSDLVKPEVVDQLSVLARGLVKGGTLYDASPVEVTGIFSLARLLKDPDITRALSYVATLAKAVGQELDAPDSPVVSN